MTLNFSEEINTDEFIFSSKLVHLTGHSMLLSKHKNVKHLSVSGNIYLSAQPGVKSLGVR